MAQAGVAMKRHVALSILDQGALSILSLGLNLTLIAYASPEQFGHFVMIFSGLVFATSAQNALIFTPLNVLLPGRDKSQQVQHLSMLTSISLVALAAQVLVGGGLLLLVQVDPILSIAIVAYFGTSLLREYSRAVFLVREAVGRALALDTIFIVLSALAVAGLWQVTDPLTAVIAGLTVANVLSMLLYRQSLYPDLRSFGQHWTEYRGHWHDTRWALQGAVQSEVQARGYVFVTQAWQGASVLGMLQAGRVLLAPLPLIAGAWGRVARPKLVAMMHRNPEADGLPILVGGLMTVTGASLAYAVLIALVWPLIESFVFTDKYPDMTGIVMLWWTQALLASLNAVLGTLLQARRQFRVLAMVGLATAVGSLLALVVLSATSLPALVALVILVASEVLCGLGYLALIFRNQVASRSLRGEPVR